jgi:hypothetical protein
LGTRAKKGGNEEDEEEADEEEIRGKSGALPVFQQAAKPRNGIRVHERHEKHEKYERPDGCGSCLTHPPG